MELDDAAERSPVYVEAEISVGSVASHDEVGYIICFIMSRNSLNADLYRFADE